jgi:hypothetical protein
VPGAFVKVTGTQQRELEPEYLGRGSELTIGCGDMSPSSREIARCGHGGPMARLKREERPLAPRTGTDYEHGEPPSSGARSHEKQKPSRNLRSLRTLQSLPLPTPPNVREDVASEEGLWRPALRSTVRPWMA